MFLKKSKNKTPETPVLPSEMTEKIRTMPVKFYQEERKKRGYGRFLAILAILIFLITFVIAAVFLVLQQGNFSFVSLGEEKNASPEVMASPEVNTPIAGNAENVPELTQPDSGNGQETNESAQNPDNPLAGAPDLTLDTSDIDGDTLTGEEEKIFATNSNSRDTDADGFSDNNELLSGYDPRLSGKTLLESGLVLSYAVDSSASLLYPKTWLVKSAGTLTIFDTKKGDSISVAVSQNNERLEPTAWISENDPAVFSDVASDGVGVVEANLISKKKAYRTNDNLKYYVFSDDLTSVYVFSYRPSIFTSIPFLTTFQVMINSLN